MPRGSVRSSLSSSGRRHGEGGGCRSRAGADRSGLAPGNGRDLRCIKTPSGRAVHTTHVGSYETLGESYGRPARWSRDHGLSITGPFWEIHGHWNDDPDLLETELYRLIM